MKTRLPKSFVRLGLDIESAELHQKRFEMLDDIAKPFVEINISTGEIKLSPGLFRQFTVREWTKKQPPAQSTVSKTRLKEALRAAAGVSSAGPAADSGKGASAPVKKAPKPLPKRPKPAKNGT